MLDISDGYIRTYTNSGETVVEVNINYLNSVNLENRLAVWDSIDDIREIIRYCISKAPRKLVGWKVLLAIPVEWKRENMLLLYKHAAGKVKNLRNIFFLDNVNVGLLGALRQNDVSSFAVARRSTSSSSCNLGHLIEDYEALS